MDIFCQILIGIALGMAAIAIYFEGFYDGKKDRQLKKLRADCGLNEERNMYDLILGIFHHKLINVVFVLSIIWGLVVFMYAFWKILSQQ